MELGWGNGVRYARELECESLNVRSDVTTVILIPAQSSHSQFP